MTTLVRSYTYTHAHRRTDTHTAYTQTDRHSRTCIHTSNYITLHSYTSFTLGTRNVMRTRDPRYWQAMRENATLHFYRDVLWGTDATHDNVITRHSCVQYSYVSPRATHDFQCDANWIPYKMVLHVNETEYKTGTANLCGSVPCAIACMCACVRACVCACVYVHVCVCICEVLCLYHVMSFSNV